MVRILSDFCAAIFVSQVIYLIPVAQAHVPPFFTYNSVCFGTICVGDRVLDSINRVGVVTGIEGNTIVYGDEKNEFRSFAGHVVKEDSTVAKGIAIDQSNNIGEIIATFTNKKVLFQTEHKNKVIDSTVQPLRRQIPAPSDTPSVLSTSLHLVGTPIRYFEKDAIEFQGLDGSSFIDDQWFAETSHLSGQHTLFKDDDVIHISGTRAKVEKVFSNGTVLAKSLNSKGLNQNSKPVYLSGNMPTLENINFKTWTESMRRTWIRVLSSAVCTEKPYIGALFSYWIRSSDAPALYEVLKQDLEQNPTWLNVANSSAGNSRAKSNTVKNCIKKMKAHLND
jgi:hypothetical protein